MLKKVLITLAALVLVALSACGEDTENRDGVAKISASLPQSAIKRNSETLFEYVFKAFRYQQQLS